MLMDYGFDSTPNKYADPDIFPGAAIVLLGSCSDQVISKQACLNQSDELL